VTRRKSKYRCYQQRPCSKCNHRGIQDQCTGKAIATFSENFVNETSVTGESGSNTNLSSIQEYFVEGNYVTDNLLLLSPIYSDEEVALSRMKSELTRIPFMILVTLSCR
jgi:hypothetical protein